MTYRIKKAIHQYSLVDLLEILISKNHPELHLAKEEYKKRKPSEDELTIAKKGLEIRLKSRNRPLSTVDKILFILIPFLSIGGPLQSHSEVVDEEFQSLLKKFELYGESKKVDELKKLKKKSMIFKINVLKFCLILSLIIFIYTLIKLI
jgi:hypothetical protein